LNTLYLQSAEEVKNIHHPHGLAIYNVTERCVNSNDLRTLLILCSFMCYLVASVMCKYILIETYSILEPLAVCSFETIRILSFIP